MQKPPLTKYEKERISHLKENHQKLESLGIRPLVASLKASAGQDNKKRKNGDDKDHDKDHDEDEEYNPEKEDDGESDNSAEVDNNYMLIVYTEFFMICTCTNLVISYRKWQLFRKRGLCRDRELVQERMQLWLRRILRSI